MKAPAPPDDGTLQFKNDTAQERYPWIFEKLREACPRAQRVLCYGCSTGVEMEALRRRFPAARIVGIDVNPTVLAEARRRAEGDGNMEVHSSTASLPKASFDAATCLSVLCSYPPTTARPRLPFRLFAAAVRELAALLRPGGVVAVYNAQYLIRDVFGAGGTLEAYWEGSASASTFLENFPVFRPDGSVTEERMPLLHRRRGLAPPRTKSLGWLRQRYMAIDDAVQKHGCQSVLFYYCWRGQAFQHSTLHLSGLRVDGYEPDPGPFLAARQYTYVNPTADTRIARRIEELRPPYDAVVAMTGRFSLGGSSGDENGTFASEHLPAMLELLATGPQARLLFSGPQPARGALPGCRLDWEMRGATLACYRRA
jgi:SAM-dependent methyltransferase